MPIASAEHGVGLVRYDAMCHAIAECRRVDEAKDLRDKARAFEIYARQAQNVEAERQAGEIRLRAERQAGVLLKELKEAGQRALPKDGPSSRDARPDKPTLKDLGVSKTQSSQWQQLADIPQAEFEEILAKPGPRPTTEGILNRNGPATLIPQLHLDPTALLLEGRIRWFEEEGILEMDPAELLVKMPDFHQESMRRVAPRLIEWLRRIR